MYLCVCHAHRTMENVFTCSAKMNIRHAFIKIKMTLKTEFSNLLMPRIPKYDNALLKDPFLKHNLNNLEKYLLYEKNRDLKF